MARRKRPRRDLPVETIWRAAASVVDGRYLPAKGRRTGTILVPEGPWEIELAAVVVQVGTAPVTMTRCRTVVLGRGRFRFKIHPRGKLDGLTRMLGLGGVPLRDPRLRRSVVARSRDADRVRTLVRDPAVSEPVSRYRLRLSFGPAGWGIRRRVGRAARLLTVEADGLVATEERLVAMVALGRTTLARLVALGAVEAAPIPGG